MIPTLGYVCNKQVDAIPTLGYVCNKQIDAIPTLGYVCNKQIDVIPTLGYVWGTKWEIFTEELLYIVASYQVSVICPSGFREDF